MSTPWIAVGRYKLRPEPRIACLNLVLVFTLVCATLLLGTAEGRSLPSLADSGSLQARAACRSNSSQPLHHVKVKHAKTDSEASLGPAPVSGGPRKATQPAVALDH
jgi:hypothetical protein